MLWRGRRQSTNVEDRRGISGGSIAAGGGIIGVIVLLLNFFLGGDSPMPDQLPNLQQEQPMSAEAQAEDDARAEFVKVVLADTEDVWYHLFEKEGGRYSPPTLVLYRDRVQSACGVAGSQSGPFYCPGDQKLYIDLSFYEELQSRFRAPGDFAMAYVVAHEVGHHIQHLMGLTTKMARMRQQLSQEEYNAYSVKMELQADFFAGVFAHHAQKMKNILQEGDIEEALNAANAIGDDRLQKQAQGYVVPESFTHGTSQQRMYWFKRGFDTGDLSKGDTFSEVR